MTLTDVAVEAAVEAAAEAAVAVPSVPLGFTSTIVTVLPAMIVSIASEKAVRNVAESLVIPMITWMYNTVYGAHDRAVD
jgi:hypothetical protein